MDKIKISNFRKIKETWDLDLAPITFFTGKNSSGKSSVLKGMMVLSDYINSDNHFFLNFDGDFANKHRVKTFDEAKNWSNKDLKQIKFEFKNRGSLVELVFEDIEEEEYFRLIRQYYSSPHSDPVFEQGKIRRGILNTLKITRSDGRVFSIIRNFGLDYQIVLDVDLISTIYSTSNIRVVNRTLIDADISKLIDAINENLDIPHVETIEEIFEIDVPVKIKTNRDWISALELARVLLQKKKAATKQSEPKESQMYNPSFSLTSIFDNDRLVIDRVIVKTLLKYFEVESSKKNNDFGSFDKKTEANKLLEFAEWVMRQLSFEVYHLSPNRANQTKIYDIRKRETDINNLLFQYDKAPFFNDSTVDVIEDFLKDFNIGDKCEIVSVEDNLYAIKLSNKNIKADLKDQGYGIGQLFVILLQVVLVIEDRLKHLHETEHRKRIIIIEEPEANLHPKLQSDLILFFLKIYLQYGIHFILETHSEYMIRKSQLLNLENKCFKLYYFGDDGPYEMKYRDNGRFDKDFGEGFFDEASKTAIKIMKLARENQ